MPFASQAQFRYLWATHPDIAKRWSAEGYGYPRKMRVRPVGTSSEESPNPSVQKLPRLPGAKRDYGMLKPDQKSRHIISSPADEKQSTQEEPVTYVHGSRHRELGTPKAPQGFKGRDMAVAHRKTISKRG